MYWHTGILHSHDNGIMAQTSESEAEMRMEIVLGCCEENKKKTSMMTSQKDDRECR